MLSKTSSMSRSMAAKMDPAVKNIAFLAVKTTQLLRLWLSSLSHSHKCPILGRCHSSQNLINGKCHSSQNLTHGRCHRKNKTLGKYHSNKWPTHGSSQSKCLTLGSSHNKLNQTHGRCQNNKNLPTHGNNLKPLKIHGSNQQTTSWVFKCQWHLPKHRLLLVDNQSQISMISQGVTQP